MTEFQTASLTIAAASLAAQVLIGAGQIGIVWWGIRAMVRANSERALAGERQERENQRRHEEVMAGFDRQGRALEALIAGMDRQGQALERQGQALETLIERTALKGA